MQITKEFYKVLQKNNGKILNKIDTFLDTLDYSTHRDVEYARQGREYILSTCGESDIISDYLGWWTETHHEYSGEKYTQFGCWILIDGNISNVKIQFRGYVLKEEISYKETFWGGRKEIKNKKIEKLNVLYYPFVDSLEHEEISEPLMLKRIKSGSIKVFINGEEFLKFIKSQENLSQHPIKFEKLEPLLACINDIIDWYKQSLDKDKNQLTNEINLFDIDNNGIIDIIKGNDDFMSLFKKHQKKITEIDKNYIQHFVKLHNYLKTKGENIQNIFSTLNEGSDFTDMKDLLGILKNQIHTYELILFHSLNMITSIVEDDLITFYEIYESFDKMKIFNSNWENEISEKLSGIGDGLSDLMNSINSMEENIVNGLNTLSYITYKGYDNLNQSVTSELKSIKSSLKWNNFITGIQTYQMYKINKNTKPIIYKTKNI